VHRRKNTNNEMVLLRVPSVAIENGETGFWYGRVIEFLGTHARAASRTELLSELKAELSYHIQWLNRHGELAEYFTVEKLNMKEEVTNVKELGESGGEVALFEIDRQSVDDRLLKTAFRYMAFNRSDLLDIYRSLDDEQLHFVPSGKGRSIAQILQHICDAEEFYISRLGEDADQTYEAYLGMPVSEADGLPIYARLEAVRNASVQTLEELIPSRREGVFRRAEYTHYPEELWTAFKILRRFLEHEREHIYNIRSYLNIPIRLVT
jgi:uncharacterized damage-inducible protein DinB/predicted RNase H-like HicB family nuclease